jgi:chromosome segregation ATPase
VLLRAEQAEAELERAQTALGKDDSQARQALLERESDIARLQDSLTDLNTRLGNQQDQLESLSAERDALQQAVAERDQALVAARLAQAEIRDAVKAQVADQKAQIDRLKLALSQRDAELALTATALAGKQEALATTLTRIETLEGQADALAAQVTDRDAALATALNETEQAKAAQSSLQQALAAAERRAQGLEAKLAQAQAQAQAQASQQAARLAQQEQSLREARALADQQRLANERPQLALPQNEAWSFEVRFGSLGHRMTSAQRRDLRAALESKPVGGCLLISAGADPRPIKPGYSVKTNSELASLRALSLLRGLQSLDKQAAENALVLGLSEFQGLEQEAAARRSAKLAWLPVACSELLRSVPSDAGNSS